VVGYADRELLAVRPEFLDPVRSTITVDASVIEAKGVHKLKLKSGQIRFARIPRPLMAALVEFVEVEGITPGQTIFRSAKGTLCRYTRWRKYVWLVARDATTLAPDQCSPHPARRDGATPHDLRATFISFLFSAGATLPEVQASVGHTDSAVTLEVYATVQREEHVDRDAVTLPGEPLSIEERLDRLWDLHRVRYGHAVGMRPPHLRVIGQ
jgi:integrase